MRQALMAAAALLATAISTPAQAARWPKDIDIEVCWDYVCNGTFTTWTVRSDGTFEDGYGSTGTFFYSKFYTAWPYADDLLLFYDNGQTSYVGNKVGNQMVGTMVTYVFYPPYVIGGFWCQGGCP